jgi:sarcosine oxidase
VHCAETADVAVVGLGAFGSAVAYQLARRGASVIGLDRFAPPHSMGSSHGETRITRLAVGEGDAYAPLVRRSHELWHELERQTGTTLMVQTGGLIMASQAGTARHHGKDDFVERCFEMARRFGTPCERLNAPEITRRYPQFRLRGDEVGYFEPSAGVLMAERCVATQLHLARAAGATIRCNERVFELRERSESVKLITDKGVVHAGMVVLTAGPWLAGFLSSRLKSVARVYRQALNWFALDEPAMFAARSFPVFMWMHGDHEADYFYGLPIVEGGTQGLKVATETYANATDPDRVERHVAPAESETMFAEHVGPRLHGVTSRVLRSAACLYTVTPDSGFVVDKLPGYERIIALSACSGHGFKHSAALGEAIAQHLTEERSSLDLSAFKLGRLLSTLA